MVYSSRFVLAVVVDGKPQKELANSVVPIQFGREYALRFRNKNNRRAVVKFTIDGENVSGNGYIIPPNFAIDIRRHWDKDATFRFVDLDSPEAVDHGKNGPNLDGSKGVIEAKFYLERFYDPPVKVWKEEHHHHHYHERAERKIKQEWPNLNNPWVPGNLVNWSNATTCGSTANIPSNIPLTNQIMNCCCSDSVPISMPEVLQEGCTVEGGRSGQTFTSEFIDLETDFVSLRCILKGLAQTAVYTPDITYCTSCGARKPRVADSFCGVCGKKF